MRALFVLLFVACGSSTPPSRPTDAKVVASNIWRADYAGSAACEDCHHDIYAAWAASPMRNMTRDVATAKVIAPFDGATLRIGRDTATMTMENGLRVVKVTSPIGTETYTVTKVVGGHYREDFIGRLSPTAEERVLPATYVFATKSWRYKGYSVMVKERPEMSTNAVWSQECIACHNTLPLGTTLYDELYGDDAPAYQANLADRTLPSRLKWQVTPLREPALVSHLADEMTFLGAPRTTATDLKSVLVDAARASQDHLDGSKLVELGIGCEACHNGAAAHAANPDVMPAYGAVSSELAVTPPPRHDGSRAQEINHTCARCHTVLFSQYPWTWEGGTRRRGMGGSTTNSGEGRDFLLGGCSKAMSCTTCHDPHTVDPRARLDAMGTVKANVLCTECHPDIGADLSAHTHHATNSAGSSCIGCHMAKKNMGLDYELVRYHRIGSPNDPRRVEGDRPLECALCHADKSVGELATTMTRWWPRTQLDAGKLVDLYGTLDANTIRATLSRGKPHEQAVALATLGTSGTSADIPAIAEHLAHDYPLVRYFAHRALEKLTGGPVPVDVGQAAPDVRAATARWLAGRR